MSSSKSGNAARCKRHRQKQKSFTAKQTKQLCSAVKYFHLALDKLLEKTSPNHHPRCPLFHELPLISVITPLIEETKVKVVFRSHESVYGNGYCPNHEGHILDVTISPGHALLFYHGRKIRCGGDSRLKCTRLFQIFGPTSKFAFLENRNHKEHVRNCNKDTRIMCKDIREFETEIGGDFFSIFHGVEYNKDIGTTVCDYDLKRHGFCVLRVGNPSQLTQHIVSNVKKLKEGSVV